MERKSIEAIEFENVSFAYEGEPDLLKNVSCQFPVRDFVQVLGDNGSGKSALFKLLLGLTLPYQGQVRFNGIDITRLSFEEFSPFRLTLGYSFDTGGLLNNRTLADNLNLPLLYHNESSADKASERVQDLLHVMGLKAYAHLRPAAVSGGVKKAACVARCFIMKPEIVFLDEPLVGLGHNAIEGLHEILAQGFQESWLKCVYVIGASGDLLSKHPRSSIMIKNQTIQKLLDPTLVVR